LRGCGALTFRPGAQEETPQVVPVVFASFVDDTVSNRMLSLSVLAHFMRPYKS